MTSPNNNKIYIVGSLNPHLKNLLEVLIKFLPTYESESILSTADFSSIKELNPQNISLILDCSESYSSEDLAYLKTNCRIPIIKIVPSDDERIESVKPGLFNYYAIVPEPSANTTSNLTQKINAALELKQVVEYSLKFEHGEMLLDIDLHNSLEEEIRTGGSASSRDITETIMPVSTFEALYSRLSKRRQSEAIEIDKQIHAKLISRVVPNLKLLEQKIENRQESEPEAILYLQTAKEELRPIIADLSDKSKWRAYQVVQCRLGGSTIAEQGSRFLIGAIKRKKYTLQEMENVYFLRDVYGRKGISNKTIADIRYRCSKLIAKKPQMGRCAFILPPVHFENGSCWMVEQGLLGQDLGIVMNKLEERINSSKGKEKTKYIAVRHALERKYLDDLVEWQKNTRKIVSEFPEIQKSRNNIAESYTHNLTVLAESYAKNNVLSEKEVLLWKRILKEINEQTLSLSKKKTALSLDASSRNVKISIAHNNASLDEILAEIMTDSKPDIEKINKHFYHVDTGFVLTHYLEDFFHIVDAYEIANLSANDSAVIAHLHNRYDKFCKDHNVTKDKVELYFLGIYRNLRRAYLIINEFMEKNVKDALDGTISIAIFEKDRKNYLAHHKHHTSRAKLYTAKLHNHFESRKDKYLSSQFNDIDSTYSRLINASKKEGITDALIDEYITLFNNIDSLLETETNKRRRKYLSSVKMAGLAYTIHNTCVKLTEFNAIPRYKDLIGDNHV